MSQGRPRVLVIDDERQIRRFLRISLSSQGYEVLEAASGGEGLAACASREPDLVVLDLGLPDLDGQAVIEELREWSQVPILVLSVRADEQEKIAALDRGADDYVTKPFGIGELTARLRALLRARRPGQSSQPVYHIGGLSIDLPAHRVMVDDRPVRLSPKEFDLLAYLAAHVGRVVTHRQLLREIWGPVHEEDVHYLRVYVGQLRQKLGDDPASPRFIANEPGIGYRLLEPD